MAQQIHTADTAPFTASTITIVGRNGTLETITVGEIQGASEYETSLTGGDSYIEYLARTSLSGTIANGPALVGRGSFGRRTNRSSRRKFVS